MKRGIILFCIGILISSLTFAQSEKNGTIETIPKSDISEPRPMKTARTGSIIGTFGLGPSFNTTVETKAMFSMLFDLNLISKAGFTLCLTDVIDFSFRGDFSQNKLLFGVGYHYMRDKWNIGGALLCSPTAIDMIISGKIDGGYYFTDNIGITGIVMYGQTTGIGWDYSMFNIYSGISVRL